MDERRVEWGGGWSALFVGGGGGGSLKQSVDKLRGQNTNHQIKSNKTCCPQLVLREPVWPSGKALG